jgi:hypothetical protein
VAPDEGVAGWPSPRLGRGRRLLHGRRRRHGMEGYPGRRAPALAGEVAGDGRRCGSDAEPGGTIHQRSSDAEFWELRAVRYYGFFFYFNIF